MKVMDIDKFKGLIDACNDPKDLDGYMANTKAHPEYFNYAFRRKCQLEGLKYNDPLEKDFYEVLAAYEELLREKHGRKQPAGYTRRKIKNKGVKQCLIDWALESPTSGFKLLIDRGMPELTAEYIVLKHSDRFDEKVIQAAKSRLEEAGVGLN